MPLRRLSRRTFLRGAGALVGLPLLEAMLPGCEPDQSPPGPRESDWSQRTPTATYRDPGRPRRLVFLYTPNGVNMRTWRQSTLGTAWVPEGALSALAPLRDDVLVLSGLTNETEEEYVSGFHSRGAARFLTSSSTARSCVFNGPSIDQVVAGAIGTPTPFRSLELGTARPRNGLLCEADWSCLYADHISWASATRAMHKDADPASVFDRLFGGARVGEAGQAFERRRRQRRSVLDVVTEDAKSLSTRLGGDDRVRLDGYLESVRELERRLSAPAPGLDEQPTAPDDADGAPARFDAMVDLTVLALQSDATRIVTLMHGFGLYQYEYRFLGVEYGHHKVSHHQGNPEWLDWLDRISRWQVDRFARLVTKLRDIVEPDGASLLDNSLVVWGSELGDGDYHHPEDLPFLVAGKGGGTVRPGRHLQYTRREPAANLFISCAASMGVTIDRFGDFGNGPLADLA